MMDFTIKIADRTILVHTTRDFAREYCRDYISDGEPDIIVNITKEDIAREREMSKRTDIAEGRTPVDYSGSYLEFIALQRKIAEQLYQYDTILFHGSVVAVDGVCYLFTAKSGTGKSTHTRLWREVFGGRAVMVNDDKPLLRLTDQGVLAYGTPWNGKHHLDNNIAVPLKAICVLERGERNRITAISIREVLPVLMQQSHRPADPRLLGKYLDVLDGIAGSAAFYRLQCNMTHEAVMTAYNAMKG